MSAMKLEYNRKYPSVESLRRRAKTRIPKFAFDYLDGGCNEDVNLRKNTIEIREVELIPKYLCNYTKSDMKTEIFGLTYDAPFGIAPMGLQGLIWPNAPEILAKAAYEHNIPFLLSTVTTSSIEKICEITEGKVWFQLNHPVEQSIRDDIVNRAKAAGCKVLVLLCDVPTFGFRPKDIRSGLAMPPRMSMKNIMQIVAKPYWAVKTLIHGQPKFETLKPYMPKDLDLQQLGKFMDQTFSGRLNEDRIAAIRDLWKDKLVLKGVASEIDAEKSVKLGLDGIIVSNHGGRQLDAGESSIKSLSRIVEQYNEKIKVMMDSGIRSGPDVARSLASGAKFTFMGRTFMYGVAALDKEGGNHTISLLKAQFQQIMEQIGCKKVEDLPEHLSKRSPLFG